MGPLGPENSCLLDYTPVRRQGLPQTVTFPHRVAFYHLTGK